MFKYRNSEACGWAGCDGRDWIAQNIELFNEAYSLASKHISELQKHEQPNITLRLYDSIRRQLREGATEPLFIASEALKDVEKLD